MTTLAAIDLPDNLTWTDEFQWSPVAQASERSLAGKLIVEEDENVGGRPITLRGAWVDRAKLLSLRALEEQVGTEMALTLSDGRQFTVLWRRGDSPGLSAEPVRPTADPDDQTFYEITLRLMEAQP